MFIGLIPMLTGMNELEDIKTVCQGALSTAATSWGTGAAWS